MLMASEQQSSDEMFNWPQYSHFLSSLYSINCQLIRCSLQTLVHGSQSNCLNFSTVVILDWSI